MMKKKLLAAALSAAMTLSLAACTAGQTVQPAETPVGTQQPSVAQKDEQSAPYTYADTIAWDGEYDVIVVGFGGAGASAAIAAADAGAEVLLTEKAPEGHEGGNTRYCAQLFVTSDDYDQALTYYKNLRGACSSTSDAILETYAKGLTEIKDYLASMGANRDEMKEWTDTTGNLAREYPEMEGAEGIRTFTVDQTVMQGGLWNLLRKNVMERSDKITAWFESPGKHLIQEPETGTIIGVQVEHKGELLNIRARNGVVLATGGFENNEEMMETYLGITEFVPAGTLYNTGDGIAMAMEAGANLWHMNVYEGTSAYGGLIHESARTAAAGAKPFFSKGSVILVGGNGGRYLREDVYQRHGHHNVAGSWIMLNYPETSYAVFDEAQRLSGPAYKSWSADSSEEIGKGYVVKADTLSELAALTGMDPEVLAATVAQYNEGAASGEDRFERAADTMTALSETGPYYAIKLVRVFLNTQGGPERNENAEVLGLDGQPIPHLYSAGELGGITSNMYQGGGNVAECVIFGRIAGTNAAAPKDELPPYEAQEPVQSSILYTVDYVEENEGDQYDLSGNEYTGIGQGMGGDVVVKVRTADGIIEDVQVLEHMETEGICEKAIETVPAAIVAAQSADVAKAG